MTVRAPRNQAGRPGSKTTQERLRPMKRSISDVFCLLLFLLLMSGTVGAAEVYDFNTGWLFYHSDEQLLPREYKDHK